LILNNFLTQRIAHGLDNPPLQSHSQDDRYTNRNGYQSGLGTVVGRYKVAQGLMECIVDAGSLAERKNGKIILFTMVDSPPKELSLGNKYACLQLDTSHVGSYSDTLVPYFRT
jgi:hypothetical protein